MYRFADVGSGREGEKRDTAGLKDWARRLLAMLQYLMKSVNVQGTPLIYQETLRYTKKSLNTPGNCSI